MNKFFETAIKIQKDAYKLDYAESQYKNTCALCCCRGIHSDLGCDRCPVRQAHTEAIVRLTSKQVRYIHIPTLDEFIAASRNIESGKDMMKFLHDNKFIYQYDYNGDIAIVNLYHTFAHVHIIRKGNTFWIEEDAQSLAAATSMNRA